MTRTLFPAFLLLILFTSLLPDSAQAALPPLSEEEMTADAKVIIVGTVLDTKTTTEGEGDNLNTIHTLTVQIDDFEKGVIMSKSNIILIRCWTIQKRPEGWVGPSGHYGIPGKDDRCRFWLERGESGRWEPLEPNGIAELKDEE